MSGWGELIKQGVKSATKAMVKKGSTVSTKKIDDGVVKFVEPYSKKVTVQSKDGKITETVKSEEVRVKKVKTRTRDKSVYIADEADAVALKDLSDDVKLNMSEGELLQRIIRSGESGSGAARRLFPTDSAGDKRGRFIAYSKTKIKPDLEERAYKKNIFAREREQAAKELSDKKILEDLQAKKERATQQKNLDAMKRRNRPPKINDPEIGGNVQELIKASQRYRDAGSWAKGGAVRASQGAFIEVQNRFSNRMLPNKKRTTRIY